MFAQICAFQWTKVKWCFGRVFLSIHNFWAQNVKCKNQFFKENKCFECSFVQFEVQVILNLSSRLGKKRQTPEFLLMNDFL